MATIVLWSKGYWQRAMQALRAHRQPVDEALFPALSLWVWKHRNWTGD